MSKIHDNILDLIGKTPMMKFANIEKKENVKANILGKLECFNPSGSVKDRIAKAMIENAEKEGILKENSTIIEPTSGNTGIGIASVARVKGYKVILTMPESMSIERRNLLKAYGAQIVLTEAKKGMGGAISKAKELQEEMENAVILGQFENMANPQVHYDTTAREIIEDTDNNVDIFIAGVGTGGTLSGTAKYLKEQNPNVQVIAVEPLQSPVLSKGVSGPHKIQGIGAGFVPNTLDINIYDEVFTVDNDDALKTANMIAKTEGILLGISSGSAIYTAIQVGKREENANKNIVVILPDTGERYLSTGVFTEE